MPQELIAFFQAAPGIDLIFLGVVAGIWLLVMYYNLQFNLRLAFSRIQPSGAATIPVTVIMIERNEENSLNKNLPGWLSMGYPEYEVWVVDDFSEDNSLIALGLMRLKFPRLKFTGLNQETRYSEKLSRNLALKAASFENMVFAHPGMEIPHSHWLPGIATALSGQKSMAVGYTRIKPAKGFYHLIYRIELFFQQVESMSYCLNSLPFIATEENIAFKKQAYFDMNGFAGKIREEHLNMELIFNEVIKRKKNSVMLDGNLTLQKEMVADRMDYRNLLHKFFILKGSLRFNIKLISGFFNFMRILFIPSLIVCVILYPFLWPEIAILYLIYAVVRIIILKRLQNRLFERKMFVPSVIYGMLIPYIKFFTGWKYSYKRKNP